MWDSWIFKMAWRDSRGSRRQLSLFLSSMIVGVAALVAITSFGKNLERAIDDEAKALLGADLIIEADDPFGEETEALMDSLGGEQSRRVSFASMAYFTSTEDTRLANVRGIEGGYPFYGSVETTPPEASDTYLADGRALVDASLMQQYGVEVGDSVRVGRNTYAIAGQLDKKPRENELMAVFSPSVYIPLAGLDTTLLGMGSRAEYDVAFRFEDGRDVEALVDEIGPRLRENDVGFDTVEEVRQDWDEILTNLYRFLSVVAFIAVLLGGIGVASAIHVYIRRRLSTIAVLRCVGAVARRTFAIYAAQAAVMGLIGGLIGAALGIGIQLFVPFVLRDFLPFDVPFDLAWGAVAAGLALGVGVTVLFALLPLVSIRRISPLLTLRATVTQEANDMKDPVWWGVLAVIGMGMTAFAVANAPEPEVGLAYAGGLAAVFIALLGVARVIMWATRRFFPTGWAYTWRQGLANLFRPNNQTSTLMLSLGLGTFLIATLFGVQRTLLGQIEVAGGSERPNIVLFDIQPDEIEAVVDLVDENDLPVVARVPIVTMRLSAVNGRSIDAMREDSTVDLSWAHRREYRSTYRDFLNESEQVIDGEFVGEVDPDEDVVPISLEEEVASRLDVGIGDTLTWDVQGYEVIGRITSIRHVDWQRIGTNFFVVFPNGVLEEAPQFFVLLSRAEDTAASAALQRDVVQAFPSVSAIDLSLVLSTFDAIFSRVSFVVRFMASFSILTGLIVLIGAVVVSRVQRTKESVLLKTLGASRRQVVHIMTVEYLFLGFFAALTGLVLSFASGWGFAALVFETTYRPDLPAVAAMLVVVPALTVAIGLMSGRGIYKRTPLDVLRADV